MPAEITKAQYEAIVGTLRSLDSRASFMEIDEGLRKSIPPVELPTRTLSRRLSALVAEGRITRSGEKRGVRYHLVHADLKANDGSDDLTNSLESDLQNDQVTRELSPAGQSIRRIVHGPIHARRPVGYNREFLDNYRPNETKYLSLSLRQHLTRIGQTPGEPLPAGTYARSIFNRLLIDLSWNSSRLEGNTYSLLETERLLEMGENAEGKTAEDAQMILNHKAAIEMLVNDAESIGFNRYTILNLHALLADNLLADSSAGGRVRSIPVMIGGTVFHPLEVPQLINECFHQILATATAITDPFEQAFFAMVHLPYLQPFEDVNKRVSRLAANIPMIRLNLCPLSFVDVPERDYIDGILGVYELNKVELLRDVFVWAYERSSQRYSAVKRSLGEPDPFRLRHRTLIQEIVGEILRGGMDKKAAGKQIRVQVDSVPADERARLIEVIEVELQSLHEGNFARYRVSPSIFAAWQETWH